MNLIDTKEFTTEAQQFMDYGYYTKAPASKHPKSEYYKYWNEQKRRCLEGYNIGRDWIPGYFYFYLNFSPMMKAVTDNQINEDDISFVRGSRVKGFPDFWDGDYEYFHYIEEAEKNGEHGAVIKTRGRGYSFKGGSMLARNYELIPGSKSFAIAYEKEYISGGDGLLNKAWDVLDFIDEHTAWAKRRQYANTQMHKRASYQANVGGRKIEKGFKSDIIGISLKNNVDRIRGIRGKLILFEEAGKNPYLLNAWKIALSSLTQGRTTFGTMVAFGCVCAGTKVYRNDGTMVNIEDIKKNDGILGYNKYTSVQQNIEKFRKPHIAKCYKIETNTGRFIECSEDHPIIYSHRTFQRDIPGKRDGDKRFRMKYWKWKEAKDILVGEQLGVIEEIGFYGNKEFWEPRFIGWLVGDGSYGLNKTPVLSNCENEINYFVESRFDHVIEKMYTTKTNKIYKETRIKGITKKLRELGIYGQTKNDKRIPVSIFDSSKNDICEFLGGLFDADGYIMHPDNRFCINLTSSSKDMLLDVLLLLQKIGVHGNIQKVKKSTKKGTKDRNDYFRLDIRDIKSVYCFATSISLFPKEKQDRLNLIVKKASEVNSEISKYVVGLRFERVVSVECIGYKQVYNVQANNTHTYIANGIVTHNTGGSEGADFLGLEELFYNPEGYRVHAIDNKYSEKAGLNKTAFFSPESMNLDGYMDRDGNSLEEKALVYIEEDRLRVKNNTKNAQSYIRYIAEKPLTPEEATMRVTGSMFPINDLKDQETEILTNPKKFLDTEYIGKLKINTETKKYEWKPDADEKPIYEFPLRDDKNINGALVIYEHPYRDVDGVIPSSRYIAGLDPYAQDQSTSPSLGSLMILDRFTDRIVAEYTGRPRTLNEFHENVRRILMYYNAKCNYENNIKGTFDYFEKKSSLYLLTETPECIVDKVANKQTLNRKYGTNASLPIINWGLELINEWLLKPVHKDGEILNLHKLRSVALVKELISYNPDGNFDRVSALIMLMILRQDMLRVSIDNDNSQKSIEQDDFWFRPFKNKSRFL